MEDDNKVLEASDSDRILSDFTDSKIAAVDLVYDSECIDMLNI